MANEVNKKKLALENARKEVKDMANLNKVGPAFLLFPLF